MSRRTYSERVRCAESGCGESAHYEFESRREQDQARRDRERTPYRCVRHSRPGEVLSADVPVREHVLIASASERAPGLFWRSEGAERLGSKFAHGPGFKAFADDFPEGTRLVVTARLEVSS